MTTDQKQPNATAYQLALGALFRYHRKARGLTQEQLAGLSGLHRRTISSLEKGTNGSFPAIINCANALGVSPPSLMLQAEAQLLLKGSETKEGQVSQNERSLVNFTRLDEIYLQTCMSESDRSCAFQVEGPHEQGKFSCLLFLSDEDDEVTRDTLFLYLGNTRRILRLKMSGRHRSQPNDPPGDYMVCFQTRDREHIINELQLQPEEGSFSFEDFFEAFNAEIPPQVSSSKKTEVLRAVRECNPAFLREHVDDDEKIYLIGSKQLPPNQRPRERTLRKLHLHYASQREEDIEELIIDLKRANRTIRWTDNPDLANHRTLLSGMSTRKGRC